MSNLLRTLAAPLPKLSALAKATSSFVSEASGATKTDSDALSSSAESGVLETNAGFAIVFAIGANPWVAKGRIAATIRFNLVMFAALIISLRLEYELSWAFDALLDLGLMSE